MFSRVWKPDETLALVFEIVLKMLELEIEFMENSYLIWGDEELSKIFTYTLRKPVTFFTKTHCEETWRDRWQHVIVVRLNLVFSCGLLNINTCFSLDKFLEPWLLCPIRTAHAHRCSKSGVNPGQRNFSKRWMQGNRKFDKTFKCDDKRKFFPRSTRM